MQKSFKFECVLGIYGNYFVVEKHVLLKISDVQYIFKEFMEYRVISSFDIFL